MGFMGDNPVRPTVTRKKKDFVFFFRCKEGENERREEMEGRGLCCNREGK